MGAGKNAESPAAFLSRVWNALLRVAGLAFFGFVHWLLAKGIPFIAPPNFTGAGPLLLDISFVFFGGVYIYLLWDMVKVFIPAFQAANYPQPGEAKGDEK